MRLLRVRALVVRLASAAAQMSLRFRTRAHLRCGCVSVVALPRVRSLLLRFLCGWRLRLRKCYYVSARAVNFGVGTLVFPRVRACARYAGVVCLDKRHLDKRPSRQKI